ncbi:MAG: PAS domain S-box protein [Rhizobiaceae bacterium]|nr:PAS domain S-box protein [Rhizobiaceae bacterium]
MSSSDHSVEDLTNARLAAIVDSSFDAIISKDLNSIIRTWNGAAERLFGYAAEEAVGRSILMLIPDGLQVEEEEIIRRIRAGERVATFETTRRRKDGSLVPVSLTVSPIRDPDGTIVGASKIARDISETKANERRIRLLMREVNHRVKNQFAVILSMVRETVKRTIDPREVEARVRDRIMALSRTHDLLVNSDWTGADLSVLIAEHLAPFGHDDRITIRGPIVTLKPNAVQHLGMALHELATNAAKYGALTGESGSLSVTWSIEDGMFRMVWEEKTPVAEVAEADAERRGGFGTVVLKRVTPQSMNGLATLDLLPGLLRWSLGAPASAIGDDPDDACRPLPPKPADRPLPSQPTRR